MIVDRERRDFLARGGALVVSFSLAPALRAATTEGQNVGAQPKPAAQLPGSLKTAPMLDAWIKIEANGAITVFTGKAELGQGIKTAIIQVAAEELVVDPHAITLVTADTGRTPNEGYTAGSQSMQDSATAILHASAQVRAILVALASQRLGVPPAQLKVHLGVIRADDGRSITYGQLVTGETLHVNATSDSPLRDPKTRGVIGKSMQRVDIPAKVTGRAIYVQDLRLPGMVHARVVRPPSYGAKLASVDDARIAKLPGVLRVVRNGSFLAVIAEREYQAIVASRELAKSVKWEERPTLPQPTDLYSHFQRLPREDYIDLGGAAEVALGSGAISATYRRPYQMHASIGPSCAVGLVQDGVVTVYSHTQGVYPLRAAIAEMLRTPPERVRVIHMEGSGCYGHNGADDAGADAALIATAFPSRPVRVQWMREDEHAWEPYGSVMISTVRARLDGQSVSDWQYEVWSSTHLTRPAPAGHLGPAWHIEKPFTPPHPKPLPLPAGGGNRNALPGYTFRNPRVIHHFVTTSPLRVSALRALGAYHNVFAIESFMDELALAAKVDPVDFRLRHLDDPRGKDVISACAERFGWSQFRKSRGRGRGFGYARYKNLAAYCAVAVEVEVDRESGSIRPVRAVSAIDSGEAVNPDGIRNQTEGGIIQSLSWTLYESVSFDTTRVTSRDWSTYPILRFSSVPEAIDVHIITRPGTPFLGTGEAAQGPTAAALANAVADALGVRIRDLPLTRARVKAAVGV
ncbi:MAG TPA: molybdopterin cofactor-binding domain-containing protein [Burkholderiales bacterium]|nr:molybdopterin cofactor-binding domain-containing protein [Burkholderiales bacterium]